MAYGQTGTGKTFTMEGFKYNSMDPQRGIIPRSIEEIFKYIENCSNESVKRKLFELLFIFSKDLVYSKS